MGCACYQFAKRFWCYLVWHTCCRYHDRLRICIRSIYASPPVLDVSHLACLSTSQIDIFTALAPITCVRFGEGHCWWAYSPHWLFSYGGSRWRNQFFIKRTPWNMPGFHICWSFAGIGWVLLLYRRLGKPLMYHYLSDTESLPIFEGSSMTLLCMNFFSLLHALLNRHPIHIDILCVVE